MRAPKVHPPETSPPEADPREQAEWFQRLPEHARGEFRERWRLEGGRDELRHARRRATEVRYLLEGVLLLAGLEFLFLGLGAARLLVLVVPGLLLGFLCHRLKAGRNVFLLVAVGVYAVVYGLLGLFALGHFIVYCCCAYGLGHMHEMQRADGSEAT
jgi:hypothetical protein